MELTMKCFWLVLLLLSTGEIFGVLQTISQPGLYQLGENITYSPGGPNDVIFQITASNVEFDLGDRFITQSASNTQTGLIAIQVASGLTNVTIKSPTIGSIQSIRGTGIQVLSNCTHILIDNITTYSCDTRGIDFVGSSGNPIVSSQINRCNIINCCGSASGDAGLALAFCNRLQFTNIVVNSTGTSASNIAAILLSNSIECNGENIFVQDTTGNTSALGISLVSTTSSTFINCLGENITSSATAVGYDIDSASNNNIFRSCISNGSTGTTLANGFRVFGANNLFDDCLAQATTGAEADGFNIGSASTNNNFLNCTARTSNASAGLATGFSATSASQISFINCLAYDNTSTTTAGIGFSINSCTNPFMQECVATRNNGSPLAGDSFGVLSTSNTTPVFVRNLASRNGGASSVATDQFNGVNAGAVNTDVFTNVSSTTYGAWTNLGLT